MKQKLFPESEDGRRRAALFAADLIAVGERVRLFVSSNGGWHSRMTLPGIKWGRAIRNPMYLDDDSVFKSWMDGSAAKKERDFKASLFRMMCG